MFNETNDYVNFQKSGGCIVVFHQLRINDTFLMVWDTNCCSFSEESVSIPAESQISAAQQSLVVVVWFSSS